MLCAIVSSRPCMWETTDSFYLVQRDNLLSRLLENIHDHMRVNQLLQGCTYVDLFWLAVEEPAIWNVAEPLLKASIRALDVLPCEHYSISEPSAYIAQRPIQLRLVRTFKWWDPKLFDASSYNLMYANYWQWLQRVNSCTSNVHAYFPRSCIESFCASALTGSRSGSLFITRGPT